MYIVYNSTEMYPLHVAALRLCRVLVLQVVESFLTSFVKIFRLHSLQDGLLLRCLRGPGLRSW